MWFSGFIYRPKSTGKFSRYLFRQKLLIYLMHLSTSNYALYIREVDLLLLNRVPHVYGQFFFILYFSRYVQGQHGTYYILPMVGT